MMYPLRNASGLPERGVHLRIISVVFSLCFLTGFYVDNSMSACLSLTGCRWHGCEWTPTLS